MLPCPQTHRAKSQSEDSSFALSPMSAKGMNGRGVVYERRDGEFIFLSRLFTTRAQPAFYDGAIFPSRPMDASAFNRVRTGSDGISVETAPAPKLNWMTSIK